MSAFYFSHFLFIDRISISQNVFQNLFQTIDFIYSPLPLKEIHSRSYEMVQDKRTKQNSEIRFLFFVRLFYQKLQILEITEMMQDPLMTKLLTLLCVLFTFSATSSIKNADWMSEKLISTLYALWRDG